MKRCLGFLLVFGLVLSTNCPAQEYKSNPFSFSNQSSIFLLNNTPINTRPINKTVYPGYYGYKRGVMKRNAGIFYTALGVIGLIIGGEIVGYNTYRLNANYIPFVTKYETIQKDKVDKFYGTFLMVASTTGINFGGYTWYKGVKIKKKFPKPTK